MSTKTKNLQSRDEFFHIYNRGVDKNDIFFCERNFLYFRQRMLKANEPSLLEIVAYCLMPNHFHFIIRQLEPFGISGFMRNVCDGYTKAINKERSRSGHLFESKYKMKHIDNDLYLFHLSRYIHLNPVRACLVDLPEEWPHSSCRTYYGLQRDPVITMQLVLQQCRGLTNYKNFVKGYLPQDREKIKTVLFNER